MEASQPETFQRPPFEPIDINSSEIVALKTYSVNSEKLMLNKIIN
jgi:hypothetical protein